jgi:hypothetical protein
MFIVSFSNRERKQLLFYQSLANYVARTTVDLGDSKRGVASSLNTQQEIRLRSVPILLVS